MQIAYELTEKDVMRKIVLDEGRRIDGRKTDEVRPLSMKVGILPRTHGSALLQEVKPKR